MGGAVLFDAKILNGGQQSVKDLTGNVGELLAYNLYDAVSGFGRTQEERTKALKGQIALSDEILDSVVGAINYLGFDTPWDIESNPAFPTGVRPPLTPPPPSH